MSLRFSELDGAKVGVWGAGREIGSFAAQLGRRLPSARIAVVALDALDVDPEDVRATLQVPDARLVTDGDVTAALAGCDVVVRSPGVSTYRSELRELRGAGIPVTTATALWLAEHGGSRVIGVTGTKGKSTTATLLAHLLRSGGHTVALAGNIGVPALDLLDRPPSELTVLELSSYQIADLESGPEVAVVTNLFREHTDWHGSEEKYRSDKLRILGLPSVRVAVVNGRDPELVAVASSAAASSAAAPRLFGVQPGWDASSEGVLLKGELVVPAAKLPLRGEHNALNLCAALTAIEASGIATPSLPDALHDMASLPHRLEVIAERDGVIWVDDSISTTPESTLAALSSFPDRQIVLLGGGQDRGQDYTLLGQTLADRQAIVLGLPVTGSRLVKAARLAGVPDDRALEVADMEAAVRLAQSLAGPGAVILLSPAAPSYNAYLNFEERAKHFRALV